MSAEPQAEAPARRAWASSPLAIALLCSGLLVVAAALRYAPPAPHAPTNDGFSALHAVERLRRVLADEAPHPVGTVANRQVRERLEQELSSLGVPFEVQRGVSCGAFGACAEVENLIATLPGESDEAIVLSAHYDSVPAGPGASDDGHGVAVLLEALAILKAAGVPRHTLVFLFNDGEEMGLLGARLFVRDHPLAKRARVVLNVEARGTTGPSLMFETSLGNEALVGTFASASPRPVTGSVFATVYRMLPNDTDLTVYTEHGLEGLNFAYIGGVARYHTPLDDLAHLDLGSLQQQGDNVLATTRALLAAPLPTRSAHDAVFFDLLAFGVVVLPETLMLPLACVSLLVLLGATFLAVRRERRLRELALGFLAVTAAPLLAGILGYFVELLLHVGGALPSPWVAHPAPLRLTVVLLAALGLLLSRRGLGVRVPTRSLELATAWLWALLGLALAPALPGVSYLFVLPAFVAALVVAARPCLPRASPWLSLLPVALAGLLWVTPLWLLYDALGFASVAALAGLHALVATVFLGVAPAGANRRRIIVATSLALLACAGVALTLPANDAAAPRRLSLGLDYELGHTMARLLFDGGEDPLPAALESAVGGPGALVDPYPWPGRQGRAVRAVTVPHEDAEGPTPTTTLTRDGPCLRIETNSAAWATSLHVPAGAGLVAARVGGVLATPRQQSGFLVITAIGRDLPFELELRNEAPARLRITELTLGLATAYRHVQAARPTSAVPSQLGDLTVRSHFVELSSAAR